MSLKLRVLQKIFGATGPTSEFGKIGSKAEGTPVTTKDLELMQSLPQYDLGLDAIVSDQGTSVLQYFEDINSLFFLATSQLAYLMQAGIPEWDSETEYYQGVSMVLFDGEILIDNFGTPGTPNLNFNPSTNPSKWDYPLKLTSPVINTPQINEAVELTATATELNTLDGITASTAELNTMDGITSSTAELNILDGITASTSELNTMDGITSSTAELNLVDGKTDLLDASDFRAFSAYLSSDMTLTSPVWVDTIPLNTEIFDVGDCYDTSTYTFTPDVAGYYMFSLSAVVLCIATTFKLDMLLMKNGGLYKKTEFENVSNTINYYQKGLTVLAYANGTTDYFRMRLDFLSAAAHNLEGGPNLTFFSGHLVR